VGDKQWEAERKARTRRLIELGGLVEMAGLLEAVAHDRAALLGALLALTQRIGSTQSAVLDNWRRFGKMRLDEARLARAAPRATSQLESATESPDVLSAGQGNAAPPVFGAPM